MGGCAGEKVSPDIILKLLSISKRLFLFGISDLEFLILDFRFTILD